MTDDGIPDHVRQFIFKYLDSIELLEALLFLRSSRDKFHTANDIGDQLRTNPNSVAKRLIVLVDAGIVKKQNGENPSYRYHPDHDNLAKIIDELAVVYKVRRHRIYELMYSPLARINSFADAFRLRPLNSEGDDNG